MPAPTQTPPQQDEDLNNPSQQDFLRDFENRPTLNEGIASREGAADQARSRNGNSQQQVNQKEKQALGDSAAGKAALGAASTAAGAVPLASQAVKMLGKIKTKKNGIGALIISILIGLLLFGIGSLGTSLAPIAFFQNVTSDLNDQVAALDTRQESMFRNKIPKTTRDEALTGCTKLSIRCKFKTLSKTQVEKLWRVGIQATGETGGIYGTRTKPVSYTFEGKPYSPAEFAAALKNDSKVRLAFKRAINMKYLGVSDNVYVKWTMKKLGISKKAPELTGTPAERVKALMNKAGATTAEELKFKVISGSGDDAISVLEGDLSTPPVEYTQSQVETMTKSIGTVKAAKPPSRMTGQGVKALGVLGVYDIACSVSNMIGMASVASKVAHNYQLAQYAAPVASLAQKAQMGDISVEDGEALGKFFSSPDNRASVVDLSQAFNETSSDTYTVKDGDIPTTANPYYGKTVMDSSLYKLSTSVSSNTSTSANSQYSLGLGQNSLLSSVSLTGDILNTVLNAGPANVCKIVQNWAVRGASLIAGVALGFSTGGASVLAQVGVFAGIIAAMESLNAILSHSLSGSMLNADMESVPEERGAATWTGVSVPLAESARARGMMPDNSAETVKYLQAQASSKQDYLAIENQDASPFDINNTRSFAGSMAMYLYSFKPSSATVSSYAQSLSSFIFSSLRLTTSKGTAMAATLDESRFQKCDDAAYEEIGINADVQCNIRPIMSAEDLALDTDEVAAYMENNGYVEPETTTGLPKDYVKPNPEASRNFALDLLSGAVNGFYDTRSYGDTSNGFSDDYGKFLDYCAYRSLPFGKTFEESGAYGSADTGWKSGTKCMEKGLPYSAFRIYTMDVSVDGIAEPITADEVPAVVPVATTPVGGDLSGIYQNGRIPASALCALGTGDASWAGELLRCDAQASFLKLNTAYQQQFGKSISVTDSYRSFDEQVATKKAKGSFAATPGKSNHGWGIALDIGAMGGGNTAEYRWMMANAGQYGWTNPSWARDGNPSNGQQEPWHWEFKAPAVAA